MNIKKLYKIVNIDMSYNDYKRIASYDEYMGSEKENLLLAKLEKDGIIKNKNEYDTINTIGQIDYNKDINDYLNDIKNEIPIEESYINCIGTNMIFITLKFSFLLNSLYIVPIHKNKDIFIAKLKMLFYL